jgi:hypothetical protein
MPDTHLFSSQNLTRRRFLAACGAVMATGYLTACGGSGSSTSTQSEVAGDFEHLFAGYTATEEPNGDPAMVVWPEFVTDSPPEIRELYEFHVRHGEVMRYIPCFCGCNSGSGHHNNRDCYIQAVHPDGSVTFDSMAPT